MADSPTAKELDQAPATPLQSFLIDDPVTLRAISHPVRQEILEQLALRQHARAADLAATLGQPANAISFHLRTLARAGLIVEAPEHARDRRDRVWRPAAESYRVDRKLPGSAAIAESMVSWLMEAIRASETDGAARHRISRTPVLLTEEEAQALMADLLEVIGRHQDQAQLAAASNPDDSTRTAYQVLVAIGPRRGLTASAPPAESHERATTKGRP